MFKQQYDRWPVLLRDFIRTAGRLADREGFALYLVGGMVRDLWLGVVHVDVDLVVVGDAPAFAALCARHLGWPILTHRRFGTATLSGPGGLKVDIVTARREVYEKPAALPVVIPGSLRDDLFRRDFTINAMAISLNRDSWGELVDPYGGRADLAARRLTVLHSQSFMDDPTRILRAVRFEQRLGFRMDPQTLSWLREAVARRMLGVVHKHRLRDELVLLLKEADPWRAWKRLHDLCGLSYIAGRLRWQASWRSSFHKIRRRVEGLSRQGTSAVSCKPYLMFLALIFSSLSKADLRRTMNDFAFSQEERLCVQAYKNRAPVLRRWLCRGDIPASRVFRLCRPLSYESILLFDIIDGNPAAHRHIERFMRDQQVHRPSLKGEDLLALGVKPGPLLGLILSRLLDARIDGRVRSRTQELALVKKCLKNHKTELIV